MSLTGRSTVVSSMLFKYVFGVMHMGGLIPSTPFCSCHRLGCLSLVNLFCQRYGMLTQVVYDVFITGDDGDKNDEGLRGTSRFEDDLEAFTKEGLKFK